MNNPDPFGTPWASEKKRESKDRIVQEMAEMGRKIIQLETKVRALEKVLPVKWIPIGSEPVPAAKYVLFFIPSSWRKFRLVDMSDGDPADIPVLASDFADLGDKIGD